MQMDDFKTAFVKEKNCFPCYRLLSRPAFAAIAALYGVAVEHTAIAVVPMMLDCQPCVDAEPNGVKTSAVPVCAEHLPKWATPHGSTCRHGVQLVKGEPIGIDSFIKTLNT